MISFFQGEAEVFLHFKLQVQLIIAAAFVLSAADVAEERQKYYIYVKLHLKSSLSKVLKVLCCNKAT